MITWVTKCKLKAHAWSISAHLLPFKYFTDTGIFIYLVPNLSSAVQSPDQVSAIALCCFSPPQPAVVGGISMHS